MRQICQVTLMLLLLFVGVAPTLSLAMQRPGQLSTVANDDRSGTVPNGDPKYEGKPLSYWISVLRSRDERMLTLAFEAIRSLGPRAATAVPELMRMVAAPFSPVHIGMDSDEVIADKLYDIEVRSAAIDALASIGEPASLTTMPLIRWALTVRVIPGDMSSIGEVERFIDLVALDAQYRLHVVDAITSFGKASLPAVIRLSKSSDNEKRKLAVLILGEEAFAIAGELMTSRNCGDRRLAIAILSDMEPIVATAYVKALTRSLVCDAN